MTHSVTLCVSVIFYTCFTYCVLQYPGALFTQMIGIALHVIFCKICNTDRAHGRKIQYCSKFYVLLDFSHTVKAATLIFIPGCGSPISSAKEGKSAFIYNLVKS